MNAILKGITALACATITAASFGACSRQIVNAYDIAVKNGFKGTEAEWLASLNGRDGIDGDDGSDLNIKEVYEAAKEAGYEGTFLEFLKEYLKVDPVENNDTETIAKNVSSVMSVCCAFTTTTTYRQQLMFGGFTTKTIVEASGSAGSGVVIELDKEKGNALIVTNYHVLYSAGVDTENDISDCIYLYPYGARNLFSSGGIYDEITGKYLLSDINEDGTIDKNDQGDMGGDGIKATFVGGAMDYDIALLKIENSDYLKEGAITKAMIGNSDEVTVGEKVYAIGNANGQGISATVGVISVESETIGMTSLENAAEMVNYRVLRTDAAINHGNSGGALFNANGELIGITNAKNVEEETDNMGYALPITQVKYLIENIRDNDGVVKRAMLGVMCMQTASSASLNDSGKLVITEEVTVASVSSGAAADGKLKVGDVLKSITVGGETRAITRSHFVNDLLLTVRKGDTITLKVFREQSGEETDVTITFDQDDYFVLYD